MEEVKRLRKQMEIKNQIEQFRMMNRRLRKEKQRRKDNNIRKKKLQNEEKEKELRI